jgi:hypothetical protein
MVKVHARIRTVREKSIALFDGRFFDDGSELWVWVPRSKVRWQYYEKSRRDQLAVITLPADMAFDRGLRMPVFNARERAAVEDVGGYERQHLSTEGR